MAVEDGKLKPKVADSAKLFVDSTSANLANVHNLRTPDLAGVASELRKRPICSARLLGNSALNIPSSSTTTSRSLFQFPAYASKSGALNLSKQFKIFSQKFPKSLLSPARPSIK